MRAGVWRYLSPERTEQALLHLSDEDRAVYQRAQPGQWVDEELVIRVFNQAKAVFPSQAVWCEMLETESLRVLNAFFRAMISVGPIKGTLRSLPLIWSKLHDSGKVSVSMQRGNLVFIHYHQFVPYKHEVYQELALAGLKATLRASRIEHPQTAIVDARFPEKELIIRVEW
jgi:hypothetical protein